MVPTLTRNSAARCMQWHCLHKAFLERLFCYSNKTAPCSSESWILNAINNANAVKTLTDTDSSPSVQHPYRSHSKEGRCSYRVGPCWIKLLTVGPIPEYSWWGLGSLAKYLLTSIMVGHSNTATVMRCNTGKSPWYTAVLQKTSSRCYIQCYHQTNENVTLHAKHRCRASKQHLD